MINKEQAITHFTTILGEERVLTDEQSLLESDGYLTRWWEKAFDYKPAHVPFIVVKPLTTEQVSGIAKYCYENDISIIVKGGASCSEDQLIAVNDVTLMLDCTEMNAMVHLDTYNMMATAQGGMRLAELEKLANIEGLTTGHCPQSQPLACVGGLVATRSMGQFSTYYGSVENMVCGLEAVLPDGEIVRIRNVPRRCSGPDLRQLFIGSEGALAIITEVTLTLYTYYPDDFWKGAFVVESFNKGVEIVREIMVKGYRPSVTRVYDKSDMDGNYGSVELEDGEACMFFVAEGPPKIAKVTGEAILSICEKNGARYVSTRIVDHWLETRNNICDTLGTEPEKEKARQTKRFGITCEICADWSDIKEIYTNVIENLPKKLDYLTKLGGHVSHSYQTGTNIYFVYEMQIIEPELLTTKYNWGVINAICDEVLKETTGTISHHHGIGKVRVKRIKDEHGASYRLLSGLKDMMDPKGIMNPGVLIALE
jgi:FAD/FMN-containing dehydrogenase